MAVHGSDAKFYVGTDGSGVTPATEGDWKEIDLAKDITFNSQKSEVETTNRADGKNDTFLPGHRNSTVDVSATFDSADLALKELLDNFYADNETLWFRYRPEGVGTGLTEQKFVGFVTNKPVASPQKGDVTVQFTIRVSGAIATAAQAGDLMSVDPNLRTFSVTLIDGKTAELHYSWPALARCTAWLGGKGWGDWELRRHDVLQAVLAAGMLHAERGLTPDALADRLDPLQIADYTQMVDDALCYAHTAKTRAERIREIEEKRKALEAGTPAPGEAQPVSP